ncbi:MAG: DUF6569 family protein [Bacteroidota bacterium]
MKPHEFLRCSVLCYWLIGWSFLSAQQMPEPPQDQPALPFSIEKISPAYAYEHLQVFMLEKQEEITDEQYLPLQEAMQQKKVRIKETGTVNQLSIDNLSNQPIYIQSGDIVKGGKQDRTLAYDMIIPPKAKNVPLNSFCVEQGRWRKRGQEAVDQFGSNEYMLSSKELRMAARYHGNQSQVWNEVSATQRKLSLNLSKSSTDTVIVSDSRSGSSLQLSLENKDLKQAQEEMSRKLKPLLTQHPQALGVAFAINGEIYGVELYNQRALFEAMWPKLLQSMITEALATSTQEQCEMLNQAKVGQYLQETKKELKATKEFALGKGASWKTEENQQGYLRFTVEDKKQGNWVHQSFMKRDNSQTVLPILPDSLRIDPARGQQLPANLRNPRRN